MFFSWLKRWRRRRLLRQPFPASWFKILERNVYQYALLTPHEQSKLRDDLRVLVAEKNWEGCRGLVMEEEIQVTVAAIASLLVLGFEGEYFESVQSILVYPDAFLAKERTVTEGGLVFEGDAPREGEAWYRGPIILSWTEALAGARGEADGDNLILHEFSHQLDMKNGCIADGTPVLNTRDFQSRWTTVMQAEFDRLSQDCRRQRPTLLDCYGTENMAEFFAVCTECFFELPLEMLEEHPELYQLLQEYYRQNPAIRF